MSEKIQKDPSIHAQHRMIIDILHTAAWLEEKVGDILRKFDITHQQYNIIKNVYSAEPLPLSVQEIKDLQMFRNSDITRLIDRLVNKGLLQRNICPANRRKVDVEITIEGKQLVDDIRPLLNAAFNHQYVTGITSDQALEVSVIMRSIRSHG